MQPGDVQSLIAEDQQNSRSTDGVDGDIALEGQALDGQVCAELPRRQPGGAGAKVGVVDSEPIDPATLRKVRDGLTGL